ncbi:MAG: hypothetical protein JW864_10865 [Spirochaetes bacterium]|nr:hypothetical protein [Spirochaetota bacterium]
MIDFDIEKVIPHRKRMKLVEEVLEIDDQKVITLSVVNDKWPLLTDGMVNPIILIEIVAQTTGIVVGNKRMKETGEGVYGYLVGIKDAEFYKDSIPLGTRLECRVNLMYDLKAYGVFTGVVYSGEETLARIEIQVLSTEE